MAALTDYTQLVTSQHASRPNFLAVLSAVLQPFVDETNLLASMPSKFDLDAANGAQLDVLGRWIGLSRSLRLPISGVFFSFDIQGVGIDQGVWSNPNTPTEGISSLDDGTYLLMLKAKIAANIWDGSLGQANALLSAIFGTAIQLRDNFDMSETFLVSGSAPSLLFLQLVTQMYIQLRPATVNASSIQARLPDNVDSIIEMSDFVEDFGGSYGLE